MSERGKDKKTRGILDREIYVANILQRGYNACDYISEKFT